MKTLIFATGNNHKISEALSIINKEEYLIKSLVDIGITEDIEETGQTLEENAILKARYVYTRNHKVVFSEDTGLEVNCLDGAPGVITARYAGPSKDPKKNMQLLLNNMDGEQDRSAQFRAVIALIFKNEEYLFEGIVRGTIATSISPVDGFGYDPIFVPEGYKKPFSELDNNIKLSMSHRSNALNKMFSFIETKLKL